MCLLCFSIITEKFIVHISYKSSQRCRHSIFFSKYSIDVTEFCCDSALNSPVAPFRSDRYTRISLALCMAGVLLLGVVSAVYDGINAFAFGL